MPGYELGDYFGIRVGLENDAVSLKLALQKRIVFNHSIVDHSYRPISSDVWMGIGVRGGAVGGPTRVTNAHATRSWVASQILGQFSDATGTLAKVQLRPC